MEAVEADPYFDAWVAIRAMIDKTKAQNQWPFPGIQLDVIDSEGQSYVATVLPKSASTIGTPHDIEEIDRFLAR